MPEYTIRIREYDFTQYEGEEPDKDFVHSFSRRVHATSIADAMEMGDEIINDLNAREEAVAHEADPKLDIPAYRSWTEFRFELEVPLSPKYSHHIMKQDFRRRGNGWDAMSWREEKPQM